MGAKNNGKKIPNNQAWDKEVARIKRFITQAEKQGFKFSDGIIPDKGVRVSKKKLETIKSIKPKDLYSKATFHDKLSGETFTGLQGQKIIQYRKNKSNTSFDVKPNTPKVKQKKKKEETDITKQGRKKSNKKSNKNNKKGVNKKPKSTPKKTNTDKISKDKPSTNSKPNENKNKKEYPTIKVTDRITKKLKENFSSANASSIQGIENAINSLPNTKYYKGGGREDLKPHKNMLLNIWYTTLEKYNATTEGAIALIEYATTFEHEIDECLEVIQRTSDRDETMACLARLARYLKGGELPTKDELVLLEDLYGNYDSYEDDDEE